MSNQHPFLGFQKKFARSEGDIEITAPFALLSHNNSKCCVRNEWQLLGSIEKEEDLEWQVGVVVEEAGQKI
ncbi:hypothetical protein [Ruegeria meonggei]|uniref:hypothetical protein n=1 Tax=Ruegeria meonggei TaxID=1446476 RepID=UPI001179A50F|nr:hypothetical protein [Ruegeria meonggei]